MLQAVITTEPNPKLWDKKLRHALLVQQRYVTGLLNGKLPESKTSK